MRHVAFPHRLPHTLSTRPASLTSARPRPPGASLRPLLLALFASAAVLPAQTTSVVSPADRTHLEGSTSSNYPLGRYDSRYQQLFADLGAAGILSEQAYRRDALTTRGDIEAFRTSIEIRLSVAKVTAENVSATFSANLGTSPTTALPKTWVSFPKTRRPATVPGKFEIRIPYKNAYAWQGTGTMCLDMVIDSNVLSTGTDKVFSPSLDAQQLFASGRNLQPGYPFGGGCSAPGQTTPASAVFEVRHVGKNIDLSIDAKNGLPHTSAQASQSVLLLSATAANFPWPHGTSCHVYGSMTTVLMLAGNNSATGGWKGVIPVGVPPTPGFEMIGQVLSYSTATGPVVLSDASRLIAPPAGKGVVSSRVVHASDHTATTGTASFSVPITEFR